MKLGLETKVAIIDYGMGNLHSVAKAFEQLGASVLITRSLEAIKAARRVVLPGVGAFGDCMANIRELNLDQVIGDIIRDGKPFLGICLGLQVLFDGSDEAPGVDGLGIFRGVVKKINAPGLKIPHMGWNSLGLHQPSPLFRNLPPEPFVYFVHSYHAVPNDKSLVTASAFYGESVTAAIGRDNVQAVQFHPEKSSTVGLAMLQNFLSADGKEEN